MRRVLDFSLILAVSALTIVATASAIHDLNAHTPDALDRWLGRGWNAVSSWMKQSPAGMPAGLPSAGPSPSNGMQPPFMGTKSPLAGGQSTLKPSLVSSGSPSSWTPQDVQRLAAIGQQLFLSLTPTDWQKLSQAFANSSDQKTQAVLQTVLTKYVSKSDQQWLNAQFAGSQSFTTEDIHLLKQAFAQMQSELTPQESQLLAQQVQSALANHSLQ
ncbi:hypothetical protein LLE49_01975 [Alicyclobacillus tolerans]|uniref:hypothetical protein n=1 Tax=Alicyclobacillus tolerans TaxID=90970 RepID=UPI001F44A370|nr:hypothetical protein [Alicyclobacillus tolerans]MCF8563508.1 hypothetical protein [Alicyclobacillus tolerans]